MQVLVVLPTYNESANIEQVLRRVRSALPSAHVLVVDDSSPDGTADVVRKLGDELHQIDLLVREKKSGLGTAYRAGFRHGLAHGFDVMIEMDSDFSHDPGALPELVAGVDSGADLVVGSRYVPGGQIPAWTLFRRALSRGGNIYASLLLSLSVKDSTSGFRAYSANLLRKIDLDAVRAESYGFQIEMTYCARRAGATVVEVPISFTDRVEGTSKMSAFTVVEALLLVTGLGARRLIKFWQPKTVKRTG